MKQNGVFDEIKGLWLGNYDNEISLGNIVTPIGVKWIEIILDWKND